MKNYSIANVAMMLNVNEETVRRWIRSGNLNATKTSKKCGYVISECDLHTFIEHKGKYASSLLKVNESDIYHNRLYSLMAELIAERDILNKRIDVIRTILEEGS